MTIHRESDLVALQSHLDASFNEQSFVCSQTGPVSLNKTRLFVANGKIQYLEAVADDEAMFQLQSTAKKITSFLIKKVLCIGETVFVNGRVARDIRSEYQVFSRRDFERLELLLEEFSWRLDNVLDQEIEPNLSELRNKFTQALLKIKTYVEDRAVSDSLSHVVFTGLAHQRLRLE